jgi:ZIP family zinc transporter
VSTTQMILLGAIAGFTIYLGLPLGRVRVASRRIKAFLNAASAGILVFLLVEILAHATEPIEEVLKEAAGAQAAWGQFAALGLVYAIGFAAGLLSLLYLGRLWTRSAPRQRISVGPGAMSVAEAELSQPALRTGMGIAAGIGLHNFSEGLAIGQAAQAGAMTLAALLIVGFGLHNTTEGFGIVGPLAAAGVRASWSWLGLALVGGGRPSSAPSSAPRSAPPTCLSAAWRWPRVRCT